MDCRSTSISTCAAEGGGCWCCCCVGAEATTTAGEDDVAGAAAAGDVAGLDNLAAECANIASSSEESESECLMATLGLLGVGVIAFASTAGVVAAVSATTGTDSAAGETAEAAAADGVGEDDPKTSSIGSSKYLMLLDFDEEVFPPGGGGVARRFDMLKELLDEAKLGAAGAAGTAFAGATTAGLAAGFN